MTGLSGTPVSSRPHLARARRAAGHTQHSLAVFLGVERSTISRWEAGYTEPQPHLRPVLAEVCKMSLDELAALLDPSASARPPKALNPLNVRVGARIRQEREARGWSKREMARRLFAAANIVNGDITSMARQIRHWEKGANYPRDWASTIALIFELDEADLFGSMSADPLGEEEAAEVVKRRRLLESLVALGAVTAAQRDALSVVRNAFDASLAQHGHGNAVDDWREVADEHGRSYLFTPRQALMPELAGDIVALMDVIDRETDTVRLGGLYGVGATLASLMAMTTSALELLGESRHWWRSARRYADVSDDRDVRVWVQGHESMSSLYQGRPYRMVLDQAESAIRLSNGRATPGLLEAMGAKAQTLAQIGAVDEAKTTLRQAWTAFEKLPSSATADSGSILNCPENRLLHAESFVYSAFGPAKEASRAHAAALAAYSPDRAPALAQVSLHAATTMVRQGDIGDGIAHAERTFTGLPVAHRHRGIRVIAKRVLDAVPEAEAGRPVVAEYRERLAQPIAV
ncbi:helix-turn-helix domain-containing protein [Actinomadura graeca]|uniref:Helix-turn-helix domain-containing protein n=1 Tax=Actinomadura graeca TaxID=2750812 RepID=A0ABX8QU98_9ACTN|nr:helix-turn-helix transcriptional regulator [Actinomadura graeca]QXJ21941.1 helix-turn-helix domain-containing protein [Actinomadura graeca]